MNVQIEESWKARLEPEFEKDYFKVGERYGRVLYLKDYASYTGRIQSLSDIPSGKAHIQRF